MTLPKATSRTRKSTQANTGDIHQVSSSKMPKKVQKKKRTKDPNAPKRPLTAFFLFCKDERPKVKTAMPDSTIGQVGKELGLRWKSCTEEQKAKYKNLADEGKALYAKDLQAYKSSKETAKNGFSNEEDEDNDSENDD